ncbi:MAG: hypothetical protein QG580_282 [Patescibacteria group bacterium]|jgi:hypothetical protein|nr:hypothetical protein [Patescibacteria group bacterium]
MKKLAILLFGLFLCIKTSGQTVLSLEQTCKGDKKESYNIPGVGILIHIKCTGEKTKDLFVIKSNHDAEYGLLLNDEYVMQEGKKKIESYGTKFFIVKVIGKNIKYKYDFALKSWTKIEKKPPTWRTGDRE